MKYIGIVYRIFYGELSYVGSTIDLKERIRHHISAYKNNRDYCSSKEIMCFDDYEVFSNANKLYVRDSVESEGTVSVGVATDLGVTGAIPGYLTGRRPITGLVFPRGVYNK